MHRRRFAWAAVAVSSLALSVFACSGEGEGQRCDLRDPAGGTDDSPGTSDCANGLKCYAASSISGTGGTYGGAGDKDTIGVCCPYSRSPTDPVTICASSSEGPDAAVPADSGGAGDTGPTADTGSDAGSDTGSPDAGTSDAGTSDADAADVGVPGDAGDGGDTGADSQPPGDAASDATGSD